MKRFEPGKRGSAKAERKRRKAYHAVERSRAVSDARADVFRGAMRLASQQRSEEGAKELRDAYLHMINGCFYSEPPAPKVRRVTASTIPRGWGWLSVTDVTI